MPDTIVESIVFATDPIDSTYTNNTNVKLWNEAEILELIEVIPISAGPHGIILDMLRPLKEGNYLALLDAIKYDENANVEITLCVKIIVRDRQCTFRIQDTNIYGYDICECKCKEKTDLVCACTQLAMFVQKALTNNTSRYNRMHPDIFIAYDGSISVGIDDSFIMDIINNSDYYIELDICDINTKPKN